MSGVIVNSRELRLFAQLIEQIAQDMHGKKLSTDNKLEELNKSWRDIRFKEFKHEYEEAVQDIDQFLRASNVYALYLEEKAKRIDRFLAR